MTTAKPGQATPLWAKCDAPETYSLTKGMQDLIVAHLLGFEFTNGGGPLKDTIEVPKPDDPDSKEKVLAVGNCYAWSRVTTDPHFFDFRFTPANYAQFDSEYNSRKRGPEAKIDIKVYKYDSLANKYFEWVNFEGMKTFTFTEGKDAEINPKPCSIVQQPKNYGISFWLTPFGKQVISIAGKAGSPESFEIGAS